MNNIDNSTNDSQGEEPELIKHLKLLDKLCAKPDFTGNTGWMMHGITQLCIEEIQKGYIVKNIEKSA